MKRKSFELNHPCPRCLQIVTQSALDHKKEQRRLQCSKQLTAMWEKGKMKGIRKRNDEQIKELKLKGLSTSAIARAVELSESTVRCAVRELKERNVV